MNFYNNIHFSQSPCPAGTYSDTVGASSGDTCLPCTQGFACPDISTTEPSVSVMLFDLVEIICVNGQMNLKAFINY